MIQVLSEDFLISIRDFSVIVDLFMISQFCWVMVFYGSEGFDVFLFFLDPFTKMERF